MGIFSMDRNLPEMLAQDLEMSEVVFLSRRMTAGTPSPDLAAAYAESLPGDFGNTKRAAQYHHILTTIRSLGELEEWSSKLEAEDQNESGPDAVSPDSVSESSVGMEPPCIRFREPSVTTAPTSVTSRRCSSSPLQSPHLPEHSSSHMEKNPQDSWVDLEPEDDDDKEPRASSDERPKDKPQPSSNLDINDDDTVMENGQIRADPTHKDGVFMPFHLAGRYGSAERPHTSSGVPSQDKPRLVDDQPPISPPKRRSSLQHQRPSPEPDMDHDDSSKLVEDTTGALSCPAGGMNSPSSPSSAGHATTCASSGTAIDATVPLDEPGYQNQYALATKALASKYAEVTGELELLEEEPLTTASSPHHVDSWLESSMGIELPTLLGRHVSPSAPGIPLSPEVIETLRISIVGFPETMLLSSSLTIETIRSYSRKFRHGDNHNGPDDQSILSFSPSTVDSPRRWKLSSLLSPRRAASPKTTWRKPTSEPTSPRQAISSEPDAASPNWSSLKNIFPWGSDYLCDALYAHLVAYNYISALYGTGHRAKSAGGHNGPCDAASARLSSETGGGGGGGDRSSSIPKKAASLLGLSGGDADQPRIPASSSGMLRRKIFGADGAAGGAMVPPPPLRARPADDPSMWELQVGLGKCISRLVATLKLTGGTKSEAATATAPVDALLLRALCEVVRCSEEAR